MNELYHHGILGQKWGKKNGPPYPLDSSDHSASEKKAGWRKSLGENAKKKISSGVEIQVKKNINNTRMTTDPMYRTRYSRQVFDEKITNSKEQYNRLGKPSKPASANNRLKEIEGMSDEELDRYISRLEKEKKYLDLSGRTITQGQNFVENLAIAGVTALATTVITVGAKKGGEAIVAAILNKGVSSTVFNAIYKKK